jgi:hypothetical protein
MWIGYTAHGHKLVVLEETTPPLCGTPPKEGNTRNSPPMEGWHFAQQNDGVVPQ